MGKALWIPCFELESVGPTYHQIAKRLQKAADKQ